MIGSMRTFVFHLCLSFGLVLSVSAQVPGTVPGLFFKRHANCSLPWGGSIVSGTTVTAYSSSAPPAACNTVSQVRVCFSGSLSGSYVNSSCLDGCTGTPWGNVSSGYSNIAYSTASPSGIACSAVQQMRTCANGSLSGSFISTSCNSGCAAGTTSNCDYGADTSGGSSGACTSGYTGSCSYSCTNGSRAVVSNSCQSGCNLPWGGNISSGQSVTAYSTSSVGCGSSCVSESRICTGSSLSGSYSYQSCAPAACNGCSGQSLNWSTSYTCYSSVGALAHGQSVTVSDTTMNVTGSATATCSNGTIVLSNKVCTCPAPAVQRGICY